MSDGTTQTDRHIRDGQLAADEGSYRQRLASRHQVSSHGGLDVHAKMVEFLL